MVQSIQCISTVSDCAFPTGLIARDLDLFRARYKETAAYGHFGRDNLKTFTWEKVKPLS